MHCTIISASALHPPFTVPPIWPTSAPMHCLASQLTWFGTPMHCTIISAAALHTPVTSPSIWPTSAPMYSLSCLASQPSPHAQHSHLTQNLEPTCHLPAHLHPQRPNAIIVLLHIQDPMHSIIISAATPPTCHLPAHLAHQRPDALSCFTANLV